MQNFKILGDLVKRQQMMTGETHSRISS